MSLLNKHSNTPSRFSKISSVDFLKNTFAIGFTKLIQKTQFTFRPSIFGRDKINRYDPNK